MMPHEFAQSIVVGSCDIDEQGHVNNVTYVRWVQDIAVAHWVANAPQEDQKKLFWVVLRHEIDYKRPAFLGQMVAVRTWVGPATRFKFERHTEFMRASDRALLAKARTLWCPLDAATFKPVQVSSEVRKAFSSVENGFTL